MKNSIVSLLSATLVLPSLGLEPGDPIPLDPVGAATFVQGAAPESWEKGQVYIIECWATWCGPCIAAIPHVDALYDKYHGKGLNVIGMNVWEDGLDKVGKFVEGKGEGMSYPVAYVGKGGAFETSWLKAAGVTGIPHAFVVKNGRLLFGIHPRKLSEETVEAILAGGDRERAAVDAIRGENAGKAAMSKAIRDFIKAEAAGDSEGMAAAIRVVEQLDPQSRDLATMSTNLIVMRKDWDAAIERIETRSTTPLKQITAGEFVTRTDSMVNEPSDELLEVCAKHIAALGTRSYRAMLARVHWKLGNKDEALAIVRPLPDKAPEAEREAFKAFADSFEKGEPQTYEQLDKACKAARLRAKGR